MNDHIEQEQETILIVDDNPVNLGVVANFLEDCGFEVITALDGEEGQQRARQIQPDIILLDVMMPGIDGFETCRCLKANEVTQEIPVIFMTALAGTKDKVKGFNAGGVDYVTKPVQQEEVLARVKTHLTIQHQKAQLQEMNVELQRLYKLEEERAEYLAELNTSKDKFFSIVAHDLRNPFTPLLGETEFLSLIVDQAPPEEIKSMADNIHRTAKIVYNLLENLLQWAHMQRGHIEHHPESLCLQEIAQQNVELPGMLAAQKDIVLSHTIDEDLFVYVDRNMLDTIIRNLTSNALKFTPSGGRITLSARSVPAESAMVEVSVTDTGMGISPSDQEKLFRLDVNHTTRGTNQEKGSGLGLIICKEMVEKNGGQIWLESSPGQGTAVHFTVPSDTNGDKKC